MPRTYRRKSCRGSWTEAHMKDAVNAVRSGSLGKNAACRLYNIAKPTLLRHLRKQADSRPYDVKSLGRTSDLPDECENDLVGHIKEMAHVGFGLPPKDVRKLAYELSVANNIRTRFNEANKTAGKDWYYGFLRRHPELSLRMTE